MKVSELIEKLTSINVNELEKYEGKEEYLNSKIKSIFYDLLEDELKSLNKESNEDYLYDVEITIKESSLK